MTGPRVDVPPLGKVLSGDEWEASQYGKPGADPTKQTGLTRVLTGDEWEHAQTLSGPALKQWTIPAVPKIARDMTATGLDNRTKGKNLAPFDIADPTTYANPVLRQIVNPAMDNPLTTMATTMALPVPGLGQIVGGAMAGTMALDIARYGYQKHLENTATPEARKIMEADPERVSGEAAAVQAAMLGLAPLIHVGVKSYRSALAADAPMEIPGVRPQQGQRLPSVAPIASPVADVSGMEIPLSGAGRAAQAALFEARKNASFASGLEGRAASAALGPGERPSFPAPAGMIAPTDVQLRTQPKPVEGLDVAPAVTAGKVKSIATESPSAPLEQTATGQNALTAANADYRGKLTGAATDYEAKRLEQDQADLSAARAADVAKMEKADAMRPRRRPAVQPFFETEQGAQTLGAAAARHGMPPDANPYHPNQPEAAAWADGHDSATATVPSYPEGFSMGGALTDNRIPGAGEVPPVARGIDGLQQNLPEGVTPENVALANALKPSRFRGHSVEELAGAALDAQKAIQDAQAAQVAARQRGLVGEAAQADMENRGVNYSGESEMASKTADKQLAAAQTRLAQIEREFAMRGVTGDQIAEHVQSAQELRAEREGMAQDEHLAGVTGEDPFATPAPASEPVAAGTAPAQGLAAVEGTGPTKTRGLSAGVERKALANKLDATVGELPEYKQVSMADQADRAAQLLSSDPALARRIALGEAPAPHDILPESVFVAVENEAIKNGDVATIRELATGKLTGDATTMGQRIRALGERDPESPVAAIKKIVDLRSASAKNVPMATEETIANIRKQLNATEVKPEVWAKFIDSLRC